jgi:PX domain
MDTYTIIYCCMIMIPVLFILYSLIRYTRHRKDGREYKSIKFKKVLITKLCIILIIIGCTGVSAVYLAISHRTSVAIFYFIFLLAWIVSLAMLIFESYFKLKMKWVGHRSFWVLSVLVWGGLVYMSKEDYPKKSYNFQETATFLSAAVCASFNVILTLFAIFCPNEFTVRKPGFENLLIKSTNSSIIIGKQPLDTISFSVKGYKQTTKDNKTKVIYNISVKINAVAKTVKRSYKDFMDLEASIKHTFPSKNFPKIDCPSLPSFSYCNLDIEEKIKALNKYLERICRVDFFNEKTLDFLGITGPVRDSILKEHYAVLETRDVVNSTYTETELLDLSLINFESHSESQLERLKTPQPFVTNFVKVKITATVAKNNRAQYNIISKTVFNKYNVVKSFKDFVSLHSLLKKKLNIDILPKFPKKSYFKLPSKTEQKDVDMRKTQLEKYLIHILNDPVYHFKRVFSFIGMSEDYKVLWDQSDIKYEIVSPVEWETDISANGSILFIVGIKKIFNQKTVFQWQTKRRYKEIEHFNAYLVKRTRCTGLHKYYNFRKACLPTVWPSIPENIDGINSDVQSFCEKIENYLSQLCSIPLIHEIYAFTSFMNDTIKYSG